MESLATTQGCWAGGDCARRAGCGHQPPKSLPEVVAESFIEGTPARPLAVPDRHQGSVAPQRLPFLCWRLHGLGAQEAAPGLYRSFSLPQSPESARTQFLLRVLGQSYPDLLFCLPMVPSIGKWWGSKNENGGRGSRGAASTGRGTCCALRGKSEWSARERQEGSSEVLLKLGFDV